MAFQKKNYRDKAPSKKVAKAPEYKSLKQKPATKTPEKESELTTDIRLNKFIANSGICSRREADTHIAAGKVKVNGRVITELGYKVAKTDKVDFEGKFIKPEKFVYVLLNKPKGFITTMKDEKDRKTVMDLISKACEERIYPVGRLDRPTTGLLLFTNDGDLAQKLAHPSSRVPKLYQVELDKPIEEEHFIKITEGTILEDGEIKIDELGLVSDDRKILGIKIHSGKNRIIRRLFEHYNYEVIRLDRVTYANLDKKGLPRGEWRFLKEKEVIRLKYFL